MEWLNIFFKFEITSIDDTEYDYTILGFDDKEIEIDVFDRGYNVRCMSWYYEFKEASDLIIFVKAWKLLDNKE